MATWLVFIRNAQTLLCANIVVRLLLATLLYPVSGPAQSLSFTPPASFIAEGSSDKAIDITPFKGGFFVAWKEVGSLGNVRLSYLGKHYDTSAFHRADQVAGAQTAFAPVWKALNGRLYLLWIGQDGSLQYVINDSDTSMDKASIHSVEFAKPVKLSSGLSAAVTGVRLLIASHTTDKQRMAYALTEPAKDGLLGPADLQIMDGKKSSDYPSVTTLQDALVRFCWKAGREQGIYFADYDVQQNTWTASAPLADSRSAATPALYYETEGKRLFYIWNGVDGDKKIYYASAESRVSPAKGAALPGYFTSSYPVSICRVDDNNFILGYVGDNNRFYLSYFSSYNPATWMQDVLLTSKGEYSLKDIVIPGSHDAGMSALNGVGGAQSETINECNTLTQAKNIGVQLNAGIRMFDLRVGTYKEELYTKHCSSDCMADAIGGGYGEKLYDILDAIRGFVKKNKGELVLLTFSHFCEKETPVHQLADSIIYRLGKDIVYQNVSGNIHQTTIRELSGKVIVTFEHYLRPDKLIDSCTISEKSDAFINFRREYAATNEVNKLLSKQELFFNSLSGGANNNDLVRLDWQLTQSADEAAMICNDFESEKTGPLLNGAMLLTNIIRKHKSIIDLTITANKYLPLKVNEWITKGVISKKSKPNILYVDAAGEWITDYCIDLNKSILYKK